MSKGILEFTLPEEAEEFADACKTVDYKICLSEIQNYIRSRLKYGENVGEPEVKALEEIREIIIQANCFQ